MLKLTGYRAVDEAARWSDRSGRVRLEVAGPDRAKFLHNLTTNEVKRLPVGRGCEAFVTSPQGKTLGYVKILACDDSILVCTDPGGLVLALPHFQKYGVFDDIVLEDRSETTFEFHLAGPARRGADPAAGGEFAGAGELRPRGDELWRTALCWCPRVAHRAAPA